MYFTYLAYRNLLESLHRHGYEVANYHDWHGKSRCAILRHDIDYSIDSAVKMARIEADGGVSATYFVVVTSEFYNIHARECGEKLREISNLGHEIGVHYDEMAYADAIGNKEKMVANIIHEGEMLADVIRKSVCTVSMHRPSKGILEANLNIPGFLNSYSDVFFQDFKYVSDSRRRWREPVDEYIENETYERLHILTHAFWYKEYEQSLFETIKNYVNGGNGERYDILGRNFTALEDVMAKEEIL